MGGFLNLDQPFERLNDDERHLAARLGSQLAGHPVDARTGHGIVKRDRERRSAAFAAGALFRQTAAAALSRPPDVRKLATSAATKVRRCPVCGGSCRTVCTRRGPDDFPPRAA